MPTSENAVISGHRDLSLDSAKGVLIVLVVFGHLLETVLHLPLAKGLYTFIYIFHMPAFVFIAGVLSRSTSSPVTAGRSVSRLLVPFAVFTIAYEAISVALTGGLSGYAKSMAPNWILWFLWSLFLWRLAAPAFLAMRFPIGVAMALAIIAFGVPETGYFLGIGRTLTFFPYFLLGLLYGAPIIKWAKECRLSSLAFAICCLLLALYFFNDWSIPMLYGSQSFPAQNIDFLSGASTKLSTYMLSIIVSACVLHIALHASFFSRFGRMSLNIYLWHGALVILYKHFQIQALSSSFSPSVQIWTLLILSIVLALILSTDVTDRLTKVLLAPVRYLILSPVARI